MHHLPTCLDWYQCSPNVPLWWAESSFTNPPSIIRTLLDVANSGFHSCCVVSQQPKIDQLLQSSWWKHDMSWLAPGCMVGHWMVTGMGTIWKQSYWMLTASYHVLSSDAGCTSHLTTMGPTFGANLFLWVLFCFLLFPFAGILLMQWAHKFEDRNALDVVRDYYLFDSLNVWIQHSQWGLKTLSHVEKE